VSPEYTRPVRLQPASTEAQAGWCEDAPVNEKEKSGLYFLRLL